MRGRVVADGTEAVLPLRVIDPGLGGRQAEILAVIDTGFTGHLTLSVELARSLALPELGSEEMVLADGRMSQRVAAIRGDRTLRRVRLRPHRPDVPLQLHEEGRREGEAPPALIPLCNLKEARKRGLLDAPHPPRRANGRGGMGGRKERRAEP
jgi:hypothetical protein